MFTESEIINNSIEAQCEEVVQQQRLKWRQERHDRNLPHYEAVVNAVKMYRDWKIEYDAGDEKLVVNGINCGWFIEIKNEYTGDKWRSRPTGKLRITTGDYGSRQSYKQRKDGTFDYSSIAMKLIAYVTEKASTIDKQNREKINSTIVKQFQADNNLKSWGDVSASANLEKPIRIYLNRSIECSVDDAYKVMEALRAVGINIS